MQMVAVQQVSCIQLCNPMDCSMPGSSILHYLPESAQIHVHVRYLTISLCHPLLFLPSVFLSIRVSSNELAFRIKWAKYQSFYNNPSNEYSGLISFRIDQLDLPVVQGTLKSLLQHYNSKASVLQHSDFFMVQLSHQYMTR